MSCSVNAREKHKVTKGLEVFNFAVVIAIVSNFEKVKSVNDFKS